MVLGILITVLFAWIGVLSFVLFQQKSRYNKLTKQGKQLQLQQLLESILDTQEEAEKKIQQIDAVVQTIEKNGLTHMQSVGLYRFNPFADTGGAQSFSVAILDKQKSGLVMTSLYGRNASRWFVKEVINGTGKDVDLSKEEKEAIKKAHHE